MESFMSVFVACRAHLQDPSDSELAAQLIEPFVSLGDGWNFVSAANHGFNRLIIRLGKEKISDPTAKLLQLHYFNRALVFAISLRDTDMAKTLVMAIDNPCVTTAIGVAARSGQLEFLQWLISNHVNACWGGTEMTKAIRFGHLQTLGWLQQHTVRLVPQHLLGLAAKHLSTHVVRWVMRVRGETPQENDFILAMQYGRLDNLVLLASEMQILPYLDATHAAKTGQLHMIKWLHLNHGTFTSATMDAAAQFGHFTVLQWLLIHRAEGCSSRAMALAALNGHFAIVKWLFMYFPEQVSHLALSNAITRNHENLARWIHSNINATWSGNLVEIAARTGSLQLVHWITELYPEQRTTTAMDYAALAGNHELFYWFHVNSWSCTSNAADFFAARGDLPMVRWLLANRLEGCSASAMDKAATNGHANVVQWLHHNSQSCTTRAMDGAAANNHLDIVKWLHTFRTEGCSKKAMDCVACHGHLDTVKWLHRFRNEGCTEFAMDSAAGHGHFEIAIFLHDERTEGCSPRASTWAADYGHLEILQWLSNNYPTKFNTVSVIRAAPVHGWSAFVVQQLCRF